VQSKTKIQGLSRIYVVPTRLLNYQSEINVTARVTVTRLEKQKKDVSTNTVFWM